MSEQSREWRLVGAQLRDRPGGHPRPPPLDGGEERARRKACRERPHRRAQAERLQASTANYKPCQTNLPLQRARSRLPTLRLAMNIADIGPLVSVDVTVCVGQIFRFGPACRQEESTTSVPVRPDKVDP